MAQRSYFDIKKFGPLVQGAFTMLLITVVSGICLIFHLRSMQSWNMILSPIFLFCVYNPIIGAFHQKLLQYLVLSLVVFITLSMFIFISGSYVSDFSYFKTDELLRMTVLVITFYFLLNLLCLMFRGVLYMLEHVDE